MLTAGKLIRPFLRLRRWMVLASAFAAAAALSLALAGPAAAAPARNLYLANATGSGPYDAGGAFCDECDIDIGSPGGYWYVINQGSWSADGITGTSYEFEVVATDGGLTGLCLAYNAGYINGNSIISVPCNSNGTSWVAVRNGDGDFLYSRYFLDGGSQYVLAAVPSEPGSPLALITPQGVGGAWFGRWTVG